MYQKIFITLSRFLFLVLLISIVACNDTSSASGNTDTLPGVVLPPVTDSNAVQPVPPSPDSNAVNTDSNQISK